MKKTLLIVSGILVALALGCTPEKLPVNDASKDEDLAGETVQVGEDLPWRKLFVLNEGGWQKNNSSLDFLSVSKGKYIRNAYTQMNGGKLLGDTGNDLAVNGNQVWIVMNGSSLITVLNAADEKLVGEIAVPSPRNIVFNGEFAYVSSYAGAVWGADPVKGKVYKISTETLKVEGAVEVGYQPEGIAVSGEKIYVANGGGYQQTGAYDNTVSIIDPATFTVTGTIQSEDNLKYLVADADGILWATTLGGGEYDLNWNYIQTIPRALVRIDPATGTSKAISDSHADGLVIGKTGRIYYFGNPEELTGGWANTLSIYTPSSGTLVSKPLSGIAGLETLGTPYGIALDPSGKYIFLADAGDYTNPGKVWCLDASTFDLLWSVPAGINPGHFAFL